MKKQTLRSAVDPAMNEKDEDSARLIAAAPDLLAECQREVEWLTHIRPHIQAPESIMLGMDQAIKYLNAAITKATGAP